MRDVSGAPCCALPKQTRSSCGSWGEGGEELTWRACESEKFSVFELWGNIFRLSDVAPVNQGVSPSNWFCSSNKLEIFAGADAVDECLSLCTVSVCVCV